MATICPKCLSHNLTLNGGVFTGLKYTCHDCNHIFYLGIKPPLTQ